MNAYAAYYDNIIREKSSSGGLFSAIAAKFDIVYGVAMAEDCYSSEVVRTVGNPHRLIGSKYIQANVGNIFCRVKADLEKGKTVLYTGTGCQVNGLKLFLGKEYYNLLCVDFICHGVPSSKLWRKYLVQYEEKHGKVSSVLFRSKENGWRDFSIRKDDVYSLKSDDTYMCFFLNDICLRPSCYHCNVRNNKMADITISDFWGVENFAPELDDNMGINLVVVRTDKGKKTFEDIKDGLIYKEVSYIDAIKYNKSEYQSPKEHPLRKKFFRDLNRVSYRKLEEKYTKIDEKKK